MSVKVDPTNLKVLSSSVILYVEDSTDIQEATKELLNKFFKRVIIANNGEDGLEKFKKFQDLIDIIVTDIKMPNLNGMEMAKEIREINKDIPIIITSAFNDIDYLFKSIDLRINKYLMKPLDFKELVNTMGNLVIEYKNIKNDKKEHIKLENYVHTQEQLSKKLMKQSGIAKNLVKDLESIVDAYVARVRCDSGAKITSTTTKFDVMFNIDGDTLIGHHLKEIAFSKEEQTKIQNALKQCSRTKKEQIVHLHLDNRDFDMTVFIPHIHDKKVNFYEVLFEEI